MMIPVMHPPQNNVLYEFDYKSDDKSIELDIENFIENEPDGEIVEMFFMET
jgi:hypothetical protein